MMTVTVVTGGPTSKQRGNRVRNICIGGLRSRDVLQIQDGGYDTKEFSTRIRTSVLLFGWGNSSSYI